MNSIQRIKKFLSGLGMLLGSLILAAKPEDGYYIIAFLLSISLLLSGVRNLIYYFNMARNMVGGKTILYRALILTDLGLFTITSITIPKIYLICHLLISSRPTRIKKWRRPPGGCVLSMVSEIC